MLLMRSTVGAMLLLRIGVEALQMDGAHNPVRSDVCVCISATTSPSIATIHVPLQIPALEMALINVLQVTMSSMPVGCPEVLALDTCIGKCVFAAPHPAFAPAGFLSAARLRAIVTSFAMSDGESSRRVLARSERPHRMAALKRLRSSRGSTKTERRVASTRGGYDRLVGDARLVGVALVR